MPVRTTFVATGNNPAMSGEIVGRSVLIRLDAKVEDPSLRSGFRHPQLDAWARADRGRLLAAVLTLGQAWIAAGQPRADVTFGGFQEWAGILGGVLTVARIPGFLDNRGQLFAQTDEENATTKAFLSDWQRVHGTTPVSTKELLAKAREHPLDIVAKTEQGALVRLGRLIGSIVDRWYTLDVGTVWAVKRLPGKPGGIAWRLVQREDQEDREDPTRQCVRGKVETEGDRRILLILPILHHKPSQRPKCWRLGTSRDRGALHSL